jgi:acid phosphatase
MPANQRIAVDSRPSILGIYDTINSTLATKNTATRLPEEFYDNRAREIIDRIVVEEKYSGFKESLEYRTLGIGGLLGDVVERMVGNVEANASNGPVEPNKDKTDVKDGPCEQGLKFALIGCHDSTLSAILASLGAMEGENGKWPPFSSLLVLELFSVNNHPLATAPEVLESSDEIRQEPKLWDRVLSSIRGRSMTVDTISSSTSIARTPTNRLSLSQQQRMNGYYVRLRYNDCPVIIPGCKAPGAHLEGDESFCTLVSLSPAHSLVLNAS